MVALLFVFLGAMLALANRFAPFFSPVVWLIVIIVYALSLSGIARSARLTIFTKALLIILALIYGYYAYGLVAKVSGWTLVPSLLATAIVFWITSMLLRYLKSLKVSLLQKTFVAIGALLLLVALNTVPWRALDTQVRAKEGARQHAFLNDITKPPNSTKPAVTKVASTKASTTPKSTTADSTEVKPTPGTQKTNNLFLMLIPVGLSFVIAGLYSIVKPRRDLNDEE